MSPVVSIIIPVYNVEKYLERCVESCLSQNMENIEIILVNDGSTDNSLNICRKYEKQNKYIRVIDKKNTGVSDTRNCGIASASGEYLLFVDSDDYLENDMCSRLLECMKPGIDMVVCGYVRERADYHEVKCPTSDRIFSAEQHFKAAQFMEASSCLFVCWNKLYRKNRVTCQFRREMTFGEDSVFNMQYISGCNQICVTTYLGYHYNVSNENSAMKHYHKNMLQMCIYEYAEIKKGLSNDLELKDVNQFAANHFMDNIWYFLLPVLMNCGEMTRSEKIIELKQIIDWICKESILKLYSPKRRIHRFLCFLFRFKAAAVIFEILNKVLYRR